MIDKEKAFLDPVSVFARPQAVLSCDELSNEEKVRILRRWKYDALEMQVAEEENMAGGETDILDEVIAALHQLDVPTDRDSGSTTKQGDI